ncbi:MAG: hypothetical protein IJ181_13815 [Acidaminococcaceae bacterium]|nr:hypothetical protein [Acidaminococcaceae bacterium]
MQKRYVNIRELMEYTGLGRNKAYELAELACCKIKLNRRALYDLQKVDAYLEKQAAKGR